MKRKGKYTSRKKTLTDLVDGDFALLDDEEVVTIYKVGDNSAVCIEANGNRANYSLDRLKKEPTSLADEEGTKRKLS